MREEKKRRVAAASLHLTAKFLVRSPSPHLVLKDVGGTTPGQVEMARRGTVMGLMEVEFWLLTLKSSWTMASTAMQADTEAHKLTSDSGGRIPR